MLVLSRKPGETIKLGRSVVITVVRIGRDKIRLGIDAPAELGIVRGELEPHADTAEGPDALERMLG